MRSQPRRRPVAKPRFSPPLPLLLLPPRPPSCRGHGQYRLLALSFQWPGMHRSAAPIKPLTTIFHSMSSPQGVRSSAGLRSRLNRQPPAQSGNASGEFAIFFISLLRRGPRSRPQRRVLRRPFVRTHPSSTCRINPSRDGRSLPHV